MNKQTFLTFRNVKLGNPIAHLVEKVSVQSPWQQEGLLFHPWPVFAVCCPPPPPLSPPSCHFSSCPINKGYEEYEAACFTLGSHFLIQYTLSLLVCLFVSVLFLCFSFNLSNKLLQLLSINKVNLLAKCLCFIPHISTYSCNSVS